ncbi:threonine dehydratase [Massilia sp. ST3]|uniref:threonine dehydratase n=1 Tax=Massilia sp. ST3 TaxID=2824903 RepID=UPI001B814DB5|nr:threonine dehydratase [Massilia sp. ST3]MBQ5948111.1 threonine dehydratase [Massilia sp. ST3]
MMLPDLPALENAARIVYGAMPATPQYNWPLLDAALGLETWVKHENHGPAGAFKLRGGVVYMERLLRREPGVRGVAAATRGNHGQSIAFAARRHGLEATIVVPHGNSVEKNAAMRALGARLVEHGAEFQESREHAYALADRERLHMVPSYHPDLVAGVASYWLELLRAQPGLDLVLVPIGQGSGFAAAVAAREALGLQTRIVGVVSSHAPAYQLSFQAGRAVEAPVSTVLADGMACRAPDAASLEVVLRHADDVIAVSDAEVAEAMRVMYACTHNVAEGAGAAALAGALQMKREGRLAGVARIGLPLTGGNVDAPVFSEVLAAPPRHPREGGGPSLGEWPAH